MTENLRYGIETVFMTAGAVWFCLQLLRELVGAVRGRG